MADEEELDSPPEDEGDNGGVGEDIEAGGGKRGSSSGTSSSGKGGKSHISPGEAAFALLVCLTVDFAELIFGVVALGWLLIPIKLAVWVLFTILFALKGGVAGKRVQKNIARWLGGSLAEMLPFVGALPVRTIVMFWIIVAWNKEVDGRANSTSDQMGRYEKRAADFVKRRLG